MKKAKKIEVAVRMRPLLYEYEDAEAWCIHQHNNKISSLPRSQALKNNSSIINEDSTLPINRRKSKVEASNVYEFTCDHVFRDTHSNRQVYDQSCSKVVESFLEGNHSTIFMYGQTTSGKTYTMLGNQNVEGLILYSLKHIFAKISSETTMMISYLQIYNEQINDLLKEGSVNLKIADQCVLGLSQCPISNIEQALDLLSEGEYQRAYAQKKYHDHSSRSHTIFQIKMMQSESKVKAILNLVDLAGSQRLTDEDTNQETGYINKSLFVLSNVISKLATSKKNSHIPFRDSKLTRLLAPSLTTSKKTLIICTISPAEINFAQTLSTLRFATQSRKVELRGLDESLNESIDVNRKRITQLQEQNSLLKRNLSSAQDNKQNEFRFVDSKIKSIEELMDRKEIKVDSSYLRGQWKKKANTLCEQYERNIQILQKEYFKAIINLTANQFKTKRENVKMLLEKASITSNPIIVDLNDY